MQHSPRFPAAAFPACHFRGAQHPANSAMIFPHLRPVEAPPLHSSYSGPVLPSYTERASFGYLPRFQPALQHTQGRQFFPAARHSCERGRGHGFRGRGGGPRPKSCAVPSVAKLKLLCEQCDRSFSDEAAFKEHTDNHEICGVDGCTFSAHPKIIMKHREAQHDSGLYKRLILGTDPKDIARWKEERRRKYPTRANINLKREAEKARQSRGERIQCPRGRFNRRGNWQQKPIQATVIAPKRSLTCAPNSAVSVIKNNAVESSASDKTHIAPVLPNVLAGLASCYASSDDDDDSDAAPQEMSSKSERNDPLPPAKKFRVEKPSTHQQCRRPTVREKYAAQRRPPTLLQKLLENEIIHERNVILQCVRHIVQNNFFKY